MKRLSIVLIALLTMVAFVSVAAAEKKATKPKALTATGEVTAFEAGKSIKIKPAKGDEIAFDLTGDTKVAEEVKAGAKVIVTYTEAAGKMTATAIKVAPPAKAPAKEKKK